MSKWRRFYFDKAATNKHGTEKKGQPWNGETRRGPKLVLVTLEGHDAKGKFRTHVGWRFIFYFPSGACWYFDICKKASRL